MRRIRGNIPNIARAGSESNESLNFATTTFKPTYIGTNMPTIPLHIFPAQTAVAKPTNPLPQLLQTPIGLAILEIQGSINLPPASPSSPTISIGRLVFPDYITGGSPEDKSWTKRVHLYVGQHQRLTGEVKKLPNPVAVIRKRDSGEAITEGDELEIAEIVYFKVIFSSRPEPVGT